MVSNKMMNKQPFFILVALLKRILKAIASDFNDYACFDALS